MKILSCLLLLTLISCSSQEKRANLPGPEENQTKRITRSDWNRELPKRFSEIDQDANGIIEGSELLAFYPDLPNADKDQDSRITLVEFVTAAEKLFDQTDKNHDRLLTSEELQISKSTPLTPE